jgi:N-acyl-L-homoserine lactone synthetase
MVGCGFWEDGYRVSWAPTPKERAEAHALRADVFCRELQWVGTRSDVVEVDDFDPHAVPIVVTAPGGEVVATIRLVPSDRPWMFDDVFRALLPDPAALRRAGSVEISRLAVAPAARRVRLSSGRTLADLLFKAAFNVCRSRDVRWVYMVTSDVVGRRLMRGGLPCDPIAAGTRMPDGVVAVPLELDLDRFSEGTPMRAWFDAVQHVDVAPRRREAERVRRATPVPSRPGWRERPAVANG